MSSTFNDLDSSTSPVNDPPAPGEPRREPPETDPYPVKDPVVPPEPIPDLPPEPDPGREPDFPTPPEPIPEYPPDITLISCETRYDHPGIRFAMLFSVPVHIRDF